MADLPKGLRVLVVEDSALVALHLEEILGDAGCEVVGVVSTVKQASDAARASAPEGGHHALDRADAPGDPVAR